MAGQRTKCPFQECACDLTGNVSKTFGRAKCTHGDKWWCLGEVDEVSVIPAGDDLEGREFTRTANLTLP